MRRRGFLGLLAAPFAAVRAADEWMPKLSENMADLKPANLRWLAQIGCKHVVFQGTDGVDTETKGYWSVADVRRAQDACREAGLALESMMIPHGFYRNAMLGREGRDREIENVRRLVRAAGEAGLPMLEWRFKPDFYWDERVGYFREEGRGGAGYKAFDYSRVADKPPFEEIGAVSDEEMWKRLHYFARPVIDAAEKAGVRLTMHPTDPPVPSMRGVAHIFHSPAAFVRYLRELPSRWSGITFCQGTFTEMAGVDVPAEIRRFGGLGKIFLVHFRAVRGKAPRYTEVFIDEGDVDMLAAMRAYKEAGYTGPIVSDHTPRIEGDTGWGHIGRSFSHGYMRGLVQAANRM
jgi:mannonate dehydratase